MELPKFRDKFIIKCLKRTLQIKRNFRPWS
jgi:hypothetical protein